MPIELAGEDQSSDVLPHSDWNERWRDDIDHIIG